MESRRSCKTAKCQTCPLGNPLSFWPERKGAVTWSVGRSNAPPVSWARLLQCLLEFEEFQVLAFFFPAQSSSVSHLIGIFLACLLGLHLFVSAVCPSSMSDAKVTDVQDGRGRPEHGEACAWIYQQALDIPMVLFISLKSHLCTGDFSAKPSWE